MTFDQRLLAQAVRQQEEAEGFADSAAPLERLLATSSEGLEKRILRRASQLDLAPNLRQGLARLQSRARLLLVVALLLTFVVGALAVTQAFVRSPAGTVNFFWLLLSLLGVNLLALLIWLAAMLLAPARAQRGSVAAGVMAVMRRLLPRIAEPHALAASLRVYSTEPLLRWVLATMIQALWVAYLLGGLVMVLMQLLTRQFDFVWETTLLVEQAFVAFTGWLNALPASLGLDTLTQEQIAASRYGGDAAALAAARGQWAALLLASLVCYGLLPRLLLLLFCWNRMRAARRHYRLDLFEPYFIGLQQRLHPVSRQLGVVDADKQPPAAVSIDANVTAFMPPRKQQLSWLGLDMLAKQRGWPPEGYPRPDVLGTAMDRESRASILDSVGQLGDKPLVIEALLSCSPDRGIGEYLRQLLRDRPESSTWLVLSGWQTLSRQLSPPELEQRVWDWHRLAGEAGLLADHIIHLDARPAGRDAARG